MTQELTLLQPCLRRSCSRCMKPCPKWQGRAWTGNDLAGLRDRGYLEGQQRLRD